jgi:hypothetical protein
VTRLSQSIAEGDGISVLVEVGDGAAAGAAEKQGADALVARSGESGVRGASHLPLLYVGSLQDALGAEADAVVVSAAAEADLLREAFDEAAGRGLECVVRVSTSEDLERALDELDPEVFLLSAELASDGDPLETLLALLHDVPAGKLAIAELHDATAEEVAELERAGVDAVLVSPEDVATLVPAAPPEV